MKKMIINILKKNQFLRSLLRQLVYIKKSIIYKKYCRKNNVDDKTIIFESFMGRSYSDNPRALYEEMINNKKFDDYKFIWCFKHPEEKTNIIVRNILKHIAKLNILYLIQEFLKR